MGDHFDPERDSAETARDASEPAELSLDAILESVPGGVIRFSASGRVVDVNSEAIRILRLSRNELRQRSIADLARLAVREDGSVCPLDEFPPHSCLATGEPSYGDTIGLRVGDRSLVWVVFGAALAPVLDGPDHQAGVISTLVEVTRLKRADAALRLSEQRFRSMFERHDSVMMLIDYTTGAIVDANAAAERFYGWPQEKMRTMFITDINQLPNSEVNSNMSRAAQERKSYFIFPHRLANGEVRQVEVHSSPVDYEEKRLLFSIIHDVSDRERLEDELRQSQKHEAIGQLSGGVAHAFNNTLTIINGCGEQLIDEAGPDHPWRETLEEIFTAGSRAAELTRQLMSFSRKELIQPEILDLNQLITNLEIMLLRLIGEHVEIVVESDELPCPIKADARSIEQALINLILNARDAMPNGGRVEIKTQLEAGHPWSPSFIGPRVLLTVTDTGSGMNERRERGRSNRSSRRKSAKRPDWVWRRYTALFSKPAVRSVW